MTTENSRNLKKYVMEMANWVRVAILLLTPFTTNYIEAEVIRYDTNEIW